MIAFFGIPRHVSGCRVNCVFQPLLRQIYHSLKKLQAQAQHISFWW